MATPRYGRRRERGLLVAVGRLLNELRYPTTRRGKVIAGTLAAFVFSFLSVAVVGGFFLHRVLSPLQAVETIDPISLLGNAQPLDFQTADGVTHSGWFFPGLRGAPVVVLCHGYKSTRAEILTLATSLQQHRYNVFAFNFAGHGESPVGYTTLGYRETKELLAALEMLSARTDIDTSRMGLWGYSLGAYAAVSAAVQFPAVKVLVVDSVYRQPDSLLQLELDARGAGTIPLLRPVAGWEFRLFSLLFTQQPEAGESLERLAGRPKLFIAGDDTPALAAMTQELHDQAPGPKELVVLPRTNMASLIEEERRNYENLVVTFYLRNLPLVSAGS